MKRKERCLDSMTTLHFSINHFAPGIRFNHPFLIRRSVIKESIQRTITLQDCWKSHRIRTLDAILKKILFDGRNVVLMKNHQLTPSQARKTKQGIKSNNRILISLSKNVAIQIEAWIMLIRLVLLSTLLALLVILLWWWLVFFWLFFLLHLFNHFFFIVAVCSWYFLF